MVNDKGAYESVLAECVKITRHYQRSIRLDADLGRLDALEGYICHGTAHAVLDSMARQVLESNQRAFTWTGPFGGGKSSLALALASVLGSERTLRLKARKVLGVTDLPMFDRALPVKKGGWIIVPVVGRRGSVVREIARSLNRSLPDSEALDERRVSPRNVIDTLCRVASDSRGDGVLLIIDEMGKFLESSAHGGDDIHFFQDLAEAAARANGRFVVVGILHQAFRQYAARLGLDTRDDWGKIQGRFSDIPLVAASDEIVELIGKAIDSTEDHFSTAPVANAVADAIRRRRPTVGDGFARSLDRCWPLHPTMAALLGPISKRQFGQNERSTFGFLASVEPHGFRAFLQTTSVSDNAWYRPENYWDFLRSNLEPAILASPDGHRWAQAVEAVERAEARGDALRISLIKNIAIIDLFRNGSGLTAEQEVLLSLYPSEMADTVERALDDLALWRVAIHRKHIGAWSIFEGSDFDIDAAVARARATLAETDLDALTKLANLHPVIAKRHYHETGTLRWMGISLCHLADTPRRMERYEPEHGEFGRFILALPDRETSTAKALKVCREIVANAHWPLVLGVPPNHSKLHDLGAELLSLQIVESKSPEIEGDSVARREIVARIASVRASLEEALKAAVSEASWIIEGKQKCGVKLTPLASDLADILFVDAPRLRSELVNRDSISSNSVKARRDLLHRMLDGENKVALGMEGYPAERGLYEILLRATGLHRSDNNGVLRFLPPPENDPEHFCKIWSATEALFADGNRRVPVDEINALWSAAPFGVRAGVHPILLATFLLSRKESIAVYKDGMFIPRLTDADMDECLQDAKRFSLRWVIIDGDRVQTLQGIASILAEINGSCVAPDPLETARGLVALVLNLPSWSQRTQMLSETARAVRDTLLKASDPHKVLFVDLTTLLGECTGDEYVGALKKPLIELAGAYDAMLRRISDSMMEALDACGDDKETIKARAAAVAGVSGDFRLDAFATRLQAYEGGREGLEGILSLAANKPPRDWNDRDIDTALLAVAEWATRFRQVEALVSVRGRAPTREAFAVVIGAGKSARTLTRTFDIAEREKPAVSELASSIMRDLSGRGLRPEMLLAALAEVGMSIAGGTSDCE